MNENDLQRIVDQKTATATLTIAQRQFDQAAKESLEKLKRLQTYLDEMVNIAREAGVSEEEINEARKTDQPSSST